LYLESRLINDSIWSRVRCPGPRLHNPLGTIPPEILELRAGYPENFLHKSSWIIACRQHGLPVVWTRPNTDRAPELNQPRTGCLDAGIIGCLYSDALLGTKTGIVRGAYHFIGLPLPSTAEANWSDDIHSQVDHFLEVVGPLEAGDLPPALDFENGDSPSRWRALIESNLLGAFSIVREFITYTTAQLGGSLLIIYTGNFWWRDPVLGVGNPDPDADNFPFSSFPLWFSQYPINLHTPVPIAGPPGSTDQGRRAISRNMLLNCTVANPCISPKSGEVLLDRYGSFGSSPVRQDAGPHGRFCRSQPASFMAFQLSENVPSVYQSVVGSAPCDALPKAKDTPAVATLGQLIAVL